MNVAEDARPLLAGLQMYREREPVPTVGVAGEMKRGWNGPVLARCAGVHRGGEVAECRPLILGGLAVGTTIGVRVLADVRWFETVPEWHRRMPG